MGLLSGRSRRASRKVRSDRDSKVSSRRKERRDDDDVVEVTQPDVEELRRRRSEYYSVPPAERRRASGSRSTKISSKRSTSTALRNSDESRRRHRRRHASSPREPERSISESQRRTEDYVYGSRPSDEPGRDVEEHAEDDYEEAWSAHRRTSRSDSSRRRSLPTVIESEVTPNDSISQVAEQTAPQRRRQKASVRPSLKRSNTTSSKLPPIPETIGDAPSVSASSRTSRNESAFRAPPVRRHSTTSVPTQPPLVECLTCGSDDIPYAQSAKLACGHRMCNDCLKRIFEMSVKDPVHMPPKCCTDQYIPLKHVDKLFDDKFKTLWNRKYQEYHTKNRIYCPALKCGEWIKPSHIHTMQGRKYAKCPRCRTIVCTLCNNKMHKSTDCPKDPEIAKLVEQAKDEGWQRCYSCNAFVERKEGCNHMTCRCLAEFCILCGSKWKTCECPWFNYAHLPDPDRLNNMRVPEPIEFIYRHVFGAAANQAVPPPPIGAAAPAPEPAPAREARRGPLPEVTYQQELDQRRRQERLDADLARRLQLASLIEPDDDDNVRRRPEAEPLGLGNVVRHFLNDDFVQNAANVVMNAFGDADLGRRRERPSGRRRRARPARQNEDDPGLAPNFSG